jgi:hypothetical protein
MEKIKDPLQIIANHGSMTSKECAEYFPELTSKVIDAKLRQGFRVGRLGRRLDETDSARRKRYIYFDVNGRASSLEPEYCVVLRTLGKPVEIVDGIY